MMKETQTIPASTFNRKPEACACGTAATRGEAHASGLRLNEGDAG